MEVQAAEGGGDAVQDLLAGGVVGHGDREVVSVAESGMAGVEDHAVEGVEVEVGEDGGEAAALVKALARVDALGGGADAMTVDQTLDEEAEVAVGDELAKAA